MVSLQAEEDVLAAHARMERKLHEALDENWLGRSLVALDNLSYRILCFF